MSFELSTKEELDTFQKCPALFLFKKLPTHWSIDRVGLWTQIVELESWKFCFESNKIDGIKLLNSEKEQLLEMIPENTKNEKLLQRFNNKLLELKSIFLFPLEIWGHIFSYFSLKDYLNILLVNHQWFCLAYSFLDPSKVPHWPLVKACELGDLSRVRELITLPKFQILSTPQHESPLGIAARCGYSEIVEILLRDGRMDPIEKENYALRVAEHYNRKKVVEILRNDLRVQNHLSQGNSSPLFQIPEDLFNFGWLGVMNRPTSQNFLKNKPPGTYLIRWSTNVASFVLSYVNEKSLIVHKSYISFKKNGEVIVGKEKTTYPSVSSFIESYKSIGVIDKPVSAYSEPFEYFRTFTR